MVRRWSHINSINSTSLLTTRHIQKATVDANLNALMYLKKQYSLATKLTRKQWSRRKHLYAWLAHSNILKDWARSYRFHRTGAKLTYYQFFTKNSFLAFNLVVARNSIPALNRGSENLVTGNIIKRFLRFFNLFSTPRFKFLTSFKYTQILMISLNSEIGRARLNSSHITISYAVFCLKKKKKKNNNTIKKKKNKEKKKKKTKKTRDTWNNNSWQ